MYLIIKFGHNFGESIWAKLTRDNSLKKCSSSKMLTFFRKKNLFLKQEYILTITLSYSFTKILLILLITTNKYPFTKILLINTKLLKYRKYLHRKSHLK